MTLKNYQTCYKINANVTDEIERMALIICELWNYSPIKVDSFSLRKFNKYISKLTKKFEEVNKPPLWQRDYFIKDAKQLKLGQFIELQHWLKKDPIEVLHLVAASISKSKKQHSIKADYYLTLNVKQILQPCLKFIESLQKLLQQYAGLFEIDIEDEDLKQQDKNEKLSRHPFIEQYGWQDQAKVLADYYNISVNESYELGVLEALNTLALLKSKQDYEKQLNR